MRSTTDVKEDVVKATVNARELFNACNACSVAKSLVKRMRHLPVLGYLQISKDDAGTLVRSTNLEIMMELSLKGEYHGDESRLLPIAMTQNFLRFETGELKIESKKPEEVRLSTGNGDGTAALTVIPYPSPGDFEAAIKKDIGPATIDLGSEFIQSLTYVYPYAAEEQSRPVLNAVLLESCDDGYLGVCAADGFRLAERKLLLPNLPAFRLNVPLDACKLMCQYMHGPIKMGIQEQENPSWAWFECEGMRFIVTLVQGTFPNYKQLIPDKPLVWGFTVSGPMLYQRATQFMAHGSSGIMRLMDDEGKLLVTMKSEEEAAFESILPAKMMGEPGQKYALNHQYVAGVGKIFAELTFEITNVSSPCVVHGDIDGLTIVIMPMFVQW